MRSRSDKDISARSGEPDAAFVADGGQPSESEGPASRYSPEQKELLEQGLCILARLAVRAYLRREASLPTTDPGEQQFDNPAED